MQPTDWHPRFAFANRKAKWPSRPDGAYPRLEAAELRSGY
jgi:hypothetical protein